MAIQLLPKEGSLGQTLGQELGSALSSGLGALAQGKMAQMQKMNQLAGLNSLYNQAQYVGIKPEFLDLIGQTAQSNPELAMKQLQQAIKIGEKGVAQPGLWQGLFGSKALSPYIGGSSALTGLSVLEQENGINGNLYQGSFNEQKKERVKKILENPNISAADKESLREELLKEQGGKSWGETLAGIPANLLSGLVQGTGSLGGISSLINMLTHAPSFEEKLLKRELASADKSSPEYEAAKKSLSHLEERKKGVRNLPESGDIKENIIRPVAKALDIENLITNPDYLGSVAERVGIASPALALSTLASGGASAAKLLSSGVTGLGSEAAGELAKRISGPKLDTAITLAGYLTGGFRPGKIKSLIRGDYKNFEHVVESAPNKDLNAENLEKTLFDVEKQLFTTDKGSKFIRNRIADIHKKIGVTPKQIGKNTFPEPSLTAKDAFLLDKELGGDTFEAAKKIGSKTTKRLTELRNGLRSLYEPYYASINKNATDKLISARALERSMHSRDDVQKWLESITKGNKGFFSRALFALRKGAGVAAESRKYIKLFAEVPEFRKAFMTILEEGAKQNAGGALKEINKINKLAKQKGYK